jgi:cell pole-organizing protein PopZ
MVEEDDVLELTQMVRDDGSVVDVNEPEDDPWSSAAAFPEPTAEPEHDYSEPEPPPRPQPRRPAPSFSAFEEDEEDAPPPPPRRRAREPEIDDRLISRRVADDASQHFTNLARTLGDDLSIGPMPVGVRTVEEVVRELLKPLLKEWLDEHLPTVVERLVQQEIDRMIRRSQKF